MNMYRFLRNEGKCIQSSVNCVEKFVFWIGLQSTLSTFADFFLQAIPVVRGELFFVLLLNFKIIMVTQNVLDPSGFNLILSRSAIISDNMHYYTL